MGDFMEQLLQWMEIMEDTRQQSKVRYSLKDILAIVLFATLANADTWEEMEDFAKAHEDYLRKYLELKNGIPSHDTINVIKIRKYIIQNRYENYHVCSFFDKSDKNSKNT